MIFSGSAVVDSANTSGLFEKGKKDGLVAIYTAHFHAAGKPITQYLSPAYSSDKGRTWRRKNRTKFSIWMKVWTIMQPFLSITSIKRKAARDDRLA